MIKAVRIVGMKDGSPIPSWKMLINL